MKRNIFFKSVIIAIVCAISTSSIVFAGSKRIERNRMDINKIDISEGLEDNSVGTSLQESRYIDDNGEIVVIKQNKQIQYLDDEAVKKYSIDKNKLVENAQINGSIYELIQDEYSYSVPIECDGNIIGMASLRKGRSVEEVEEKLNSKKNIKSSKRASMINKAKEREGKWYASSIRKYDNSSENFTGFGSVQNILEMNDISSYDDIKFVSFGLLFNEALVIKSGNDEYIIPYGVRNGIENIEAGKIYSKDYINTAIEEFYDVITK